MSLISSIEKYTPKPTDRSFIGSIIPFISVFKTMETESLIPPFLEDNQGKIIPENLKVKSNLEM